MAFFHLLVFPNTVLTTAQQSAVGCLIFAINVRLRLVLHRERSKTVQSVFHSVTVSYLSLLWVILDNLRLLLISGEP
jgi:hypothetical protein